MNPLERPIADLAAAVKSKQVTAVSLVQTALDRIKQLDGYHAILEVNEGALDQAKAIDEAVQAGRDPGRLAGVPFVAKDNFLTLDAHTTAASHILEPFQAPYQSTAVSKLLAEGAILVAKANLDAFGHGASTENSDFGPTKNPWDNTRVPGGSSGGPAAAVALGLASFGIGTDTGGSNRQPASLCGVIGLKPTYGLVSRYGVIAMGSSFDTIGPLARTVADASLVLDVMAGRDPLDATTIERAKTSYAESTPPKGLKLALVKELYAGCAPEIKSLIEAAVKQLQTAGHTVEDISLPILGDQTLACYYILVPAEISSNLERYDGIKYGYYDPAATNLAETYDRSRDHGFGAEAKRRILLGTYVLSSGYYEAYYKQAQQVRTVIIKAFDEVFAKYDALVGLTSPGVAFQLGANSSDPLRMYQEDVMTVPASLAGLPAISLPLGLDQNLPVGLQLIAKQRDEAGLLALAAQTESLVNFTAKPKVAS